LAHGDDGDGGVTESPRPKIVNGVDGIAKVNSSGLSYQIVVMLC